MLHITHDCLVTTYQGTVSIYTSLHSRVTTVISCIASVCFVAVAFLNVNIHMQIAWYPLLTLLPQRNDGLS